MGGSRAEAVPPNKFKRFLTIASIAEMGLPYNQALNNAMLFYLSIQVYNAMTVVVCTGFTVLE